jgi:hypothetical protein
VNSKNHILLTIDVEDWFQVENFKPRIPFATWDQRELRVEKNVHRLLDLFDSIELNKPNLSTLISSDQRSELNRDQPNQLNQPSKKEVYLFNSDEMAGKL